MWKICWDASQVKPHTRYRSTIWSRSHANFVTYSSGQSIRRESLKNLDIRFHLQHGVASHESQRVCLGDHIRLQSLEPEPTWMLRKGSAVEDAPQLVHANSVGHRLGQLREQRVWVLSQEESIEQRLEHLVLIEAIATRAMALDKRNRCRTQARAEATLAPGQGWG